MYSGKLLLKYVLRKAVLLLNLLRQPFKYVLRKAIWLLRNCDSSLSFILFTRELNKKRNEIFERGMAHTQHLLRENSDARKFALRDNNSLELSDLIKEKLPLSPRTSWRNWRRSQSLALRNRLSMLLLLNKSHKLRGIHFSIQSA